MSLVEALRRTLYLDRSLSCTTAWNIMATCHTSAPVIHRQVFSCLIVWSCTPISSVFSSRSYQSLHIPLSTVAVHSKQLNTRSKTSAVHPTHSKIYLLQPKGIPKKSRTTPKTTVVYTLCTFAWHNLHTEDPCEGAAVLRAARSGSAAPSAARRVVSPS